jgi:hypothetical protein
MAGALVEMAWEGVGMMGLDGGLAFYNNNIVFCPKQVGVV